MQNFLSALTAAVQLLALAPQPSLAEEASDVDAAMAAAKRYTLTSNMTRTELGVTILLNPATGAYSYGDHVHQGLDFVRIDPSDPTDVPRGYELVGIWHAHPDPLYDGLSDHVDEIQEHKSLAIFTSYEGYVVEQFWDPTLNHGRGGVHQPINICPDKHRCVPAPNL